MAAAALPTPQADAVNIRFLMIDNYMIFRSFPPQTSVAEMKAMLASAWPIDKNPTPSTSGIRIVYSGLLLEDNSLLDQTRATAGPHWVTMHLWPKFQVQSSHPTKHADAGLVKSGSAGGSANNTSGASCCSIL
eukprot:c10090_g1_i1.p1 GENE.c10090_g1_i1~~c10090_g1_i1.p1  ORF type:complete len:133 (-),score=24.11 c10090_g1_i1:301-699(-)